jgi:hypothetical protein
VRFNLKNLFIETRFKPMSTSSVILALKSLLELLAQIEPAADNMDVAWNGPYYIAGPRRWASTYFSIYQHTLYASMSLGCDHYCLRWPLGGEAVEFDRGYRQGEYSNNAPLWLKVLKQVSARLRSALKAPAAYNARVQRCLPYECRSGQVRRSLTWMKDAKALFPARTLLTLERVLVEAAAVRRLRSMNVERYLMSAAVAYDAVFPPLKGATARQKYQTKADGRHGGLLGLPPRNGAAFRAWFTSRAWAGTHPWEILFGHPHGVMFSPREHTDAKGGWSFVLSVHSGAWYGATVQMALALAAYGIGFEFSNHAEVLAALRGSDLIEVGPNSRVLCFEELRELRPDAIAQVSWQPIPLIAPISAAQRPRVSAALQGT